jgi:ABC-2 type transport system ATP-binding protein
MEQAEQICDYVCIIARGRKELEGRLAQLKREAGGDRQVALDCEREDESARLGTLLGASELVSSVEQAPRGFAVELVPGGDAGALLAALVAERVPLRRFEVLEPSLHQIFVERVGRAAGADMAGRKADADAQP